MGFSFESVNATDYDELRSSYAPEAVRWVAARGRLEEGSLVVDLAAGTGQLARRFATLGVRVTAVEPAANMRAVLCSNLPDVEAVAGTAEDIPLGDGAADAVVVGNAFHHFDTDDAFVQIRRVLRPAGALALFWARSGRGGLDLGLREIDDVVERERGSSPIVHRRVGVRSPGDPPAPRADRRAALPENLIRKGYCHPPWQSAGIAAFVRPNVTMSPIAAAHR